VIAAAGVVREASMSTTIEFDRLGKRFGSTVAVDDLSAVVRPGVVTAFLGPNGAGKTTTLRMPLGLVASTSGTATFGGRRYDELADPVREVGAVLDAAGFHPGRTALDHLRVQATAAGLPGAAPERVLDEMELTPVARRKVGGYSLGMRQRLALAAALLGDPPILVLDEPTNGLDPQGIRWLRARLREFAAEGRTVFVSSHVLSEVEQVADEVLLLVSGRLVRSTTLAALQREAGIRTRVVSPSADLLRVALEQAGHDVRAVTPEELVVQAAPPAVGALAAEHGLVLHALGETGSLEETFFRLTGEVAQ
jgi:ABC-2 type transport system ATP-binding protein